MPEEGLAIELAFTIGVIASVTGAAIYLALLQLLGPQVKISDNISVDDTREQRRYTIKVINRRYRSLIDINPQLYIVYISAAPGVGAILKTVRNISLKTPHISQIPGYRWGKKNADYAIRFSTQDDLDALWTGDQTYLRFMIMVSDNYSGIRRVFVKEFHGKQLMKPGVFETGKSMDVV